MDARQQQYLAAMGITAWQRRDLAAEAEPAPSPVSEVIDPSAPVTEVEVVSIRPVAAMQAVAVEKVSEPSVAQVVKAEAVTVTPTIAAGDWEGLQQQVDACQQCGLYKTRMNAVFGTGNQQAQWMIIGDAPGADEDKTRQPFAGEHGLLLNAMLQAVGLSRSAVYLSNTLKCRPPNNRIPKAEEVSTCSAYLQRQIELLQPKLIITLGEATARGLLQTQQSLAELRGTVHHYGEQQIPLIVSHPPAHLLQTPLDKRDSWQDLQLAMSICPTLVVV